MNQTRQDRRRRLTLVASALPLMLLTACGGANLAERGSDEAGGSGAAPSTGQAEQRETGNAVAPSRSTGSKTGSSDQTVAADKQLLTYTAHLGARVEDTKKATGAAERVVSKAGGYVQKQEQYGEQDRSAETTFKVPSAKYQSVLDRLGTLGEQTSLRQETDNVTEEVADVESRVKTAEASLTRLRALLEDATTVDDVLAVESAIHQRQADLESLQARQRALAKQVEYATITLHLTGPREKQDESEAGFLVGLRAGWDGLLAFLTGLVTAIGAVLPFTVVVAPVAVAAFVFWRRLRRSRRRPGDAAATAEAP